MHAIVNNNGVALYFGVLDNAEVESISKELDGRAFPVEAGANGFRKAIKCQKTQAIEVLNRHGVPFKEIGDEG